MHVIINGVSSETLQGVQVLSLPPITKPRMRTSVAVIDGRPGDIVTRLGYEAYNRKIQILLHHDYDLNAISAFFNTSGTIIFSNEPDMEYEFETIDAFSFERAVRYKTADIIFHVQPYKLSATEEPATGEVSTLVDKTPYIIRRTPFGTRQKGTIVGGSIVWNQLCTFTARTNTNNGVTYTFGDDGTITADGTATGASYQNVGTAIHVQGHKVLLCGCPSVGSSSTYYTRDGYTAGKFDIGQGLLIEANANTIVQINVANGVTVSSLVFKPQIYDLTLMFGPTIADYIYAQERASAGAGVALAKAWAGITADYYPYDAGTIKSVTGLTAHRMTDGNGDVIGEYPLDSSLTLRGRLKLDGDNLYYDGDIYKADGTVERRYGVRAYQSGDESDANVLTDGTNTVYKLATPTTESAEPYTELQICDPAGTEEWIGANMPVGHETTYIDPISMTVTNEGNTTSAPSITIEGEGAVEVTVDGLNILQIQMPASGEITIDSKTLDATDGEGGLANRSVTGDYNDLRLAPGEHTVTVTGDVTSVTIKNASRWI